MKQIGGLLLGILAVAFIFACLFLSLSFFVWLCGGLFILKQEFLALRIIFSAYFTIRTLNAIQPKNA